MPIYEYTCKKCETRFDKLVKSMEGPAKEKAACPKCGSKETARTMSVFAVGAAPAAPAAGPGMCGRCGGPGPCAMD